MLYVACFLAGFITFPIIGGIVLYGLFADVDINSREERDL